MSASFIPKCRIGIKRHRKCDCTSPPKNKSVERIQLQQDTWSHKHTWNKRKNEITKRWHSTGCTCPSFCAPLSSVWTRGRWLGAVAYSRPLGPSLLPKKPATRPGPCLAAVSQPTPWGRRRSWVASSPSRCGRAAPCQCSSACCSHSKWSFRSAFWASSYRHWMTLNAVGLVV